MKIVFTGGGTGGHIFPIVAIARELKKIVPQHKLRLFYIGPKDQFAKVLAQEGIKTFFVLSGKLRRYLDPFSLILNVFDIFVKIPLGFLQSFIYIFFLAPDLIFSKGGYGSFPPVLAGKILGVPIFLHESDSIPGLANRILSHFATEIFVSFPNTPYFSPKKMILVGNPVREELLMGDKNRAKEFFKLSGEKPVILVLGGSQGAQRINDKILEVLPYLLKNFEIIHQCGEKNFESVVTEAKAVIDESLAKFYHPYPFFNEEELKLAYAAADFVVSRAGSGVIFELAALGKPSILIPLPESAQEHQTRNAYIFAKSGGTLVIEEENFTSHFFVERLKYFFEDPKKLEKMRNSAKEFARPRAARIIAEYLREFLGEK
jgi:UDP-N-acetylglucosamine--N-acetylmuramyl-(pentapeptide) pyrophosphoryl-undecaprenol N-acetylglucosamine transferase